MSAPPVTFTVFTKPWHVPLVELAVLVRSMGFDGVELPVRPGYPVHPDNVTEALPEAVHIFADHGLRIASIAGPTDERTIEACGVAGVPVIRICVGVPAQAEYLEHEATVQAEFEPLLPVLARCGVTIGIQNHSGRQIANAMGLRHLIERFDPRNVAAVWDPAHCALNGEVPALAASILWSHLCMVNLKNAYWQRTNGLEAPVATYKPWWTSGRQGLCPWPEVAAILKARHYTGAVCLTAEYGDHEATDRLIRDDLAFARSLFAAS